MKYKPIRTLYCSRWKIKQGSYVIVGPVHDVVDPVVEPQYELGPGYEPQQGQRQGQQVIPAPKGKTFNCLLGAKIQG